MLQEDGGADDLSRSMLRKLAVKSTQEAAFESTHNAWMPFYWSALGVVLLSIFYSLVRRLRVNNAEKKVAAGHGAPIATARKGARYQSVASLALLLGLPQEVAGDVCTIDCTEFGNPIPEQAKYETGIFVPPIIDLRRDPNTDLCLDPDLYPVTIDITQGKQDWGIKDENGTTLETTIYGYTCIHNNTLGIFSRCKHPFTGEDVTESDYLNKAIYPGPTIIVSKDCPVKITFRNKLGFGPHMFPMDRSVHCGDAVLNQTLCVPGSTVPTAPPGEPLDFYCKCTSQRGADLRTTVQ
jgi:hypothetical protein